MNDKDQTIEEDGTSKLVQEAIQEMEKSFGTGVKKKSRIVSRAFSLNELVKDED
jgi:hypothetical protein